MIQASAVTPVRMSIVNMVTLEQLDAQYNPTELTEKLGAAYSRASVPGMSHEILQFGTTKNATMDFTLFFSSANGGPEQQAHNERARRFLRSTLYPRGGVGGIVSTGGPPPCLLVWPNITRMKCVVTALSFSYQRFNPQLAAVYYSAQVTVESVFDHLVTSEDVLAGKD